MDPRAQLRAHIQSFFVEGTNFDTYVLPAGTQLFKSYRDKLTNWSQDKVFPVYGPAFFGFNEETSRVYGYTFSYRTTRTYTLLALDSIKTIKYLRLMADDRIRNILKTNYGFKPEYLNEKGPYPTQIRNSVGETDYEFVQFLCRIGFQGYAINFMAEPIHGSMFHPECVICQPDGVIINQNYNVSGIPGLATPIEYHSHVWSNVIEPRMLAKYNPVRKSKVRNYDEDDESPKSKKYDSKVLDFGSDDEETAYSRNRNLFGSDDEKEGGRRKKQRRTKRKNKNNKSKKRNRKSSKHLLI
jgi:hypothetical protein